MSILHHLTMVVGSFLRNDDGFKCLYPGRPCRWLCSKHTIALIRKNHISWTDFGIEHIDPFQKLFRILSTVGSTTEQPVVESYPDIVL